MKAIATIVIMSVIAVWADPGVAQPTVQGAEPEVLVPSKPRPRPRTRLYVQPLYPNRHFHSIYPLPYPIEYPGPNARRECVDWYATEHRPSGTVVTPRIRCRWVQG